MNKSNPGQLTLSVVIPTYNEREGIEVTIEKISNTLKNNGISGEIIVVDDDSPDRTWEFCQSIEESYPLQVIRRVGRRGLSSAVIEGWEVAGGRILGVMDADGSHDERALPGMIQAIEKDEIQLAVGSRYVPGGETPGWPWIRQFISRSAISLAMPVSSLRDATSGFCLFRRDVIEGVHLDPVGWKIVLEVFVKGNYRHYREFPITFRDREAGQSKLGNRAIINYLQHLIKLWRWMRHHKKPRR